MIKKTSVIFRLVFLLGSIILMFSLTACKPPLTLPIGPTPIPTLIPATSPPRNLDIVEVTQLVIESYPAGIPSALDGQVLYREYCASCHGIDGKGLVPAARNFGDVDYMRGETPADFYSIITEGREVDMPAFGEHLSSDERWAVVYYIWRFSTTGEILQEGNLIYRDDCASCHGDNGRSMILGAANFSDQRFMANQSPSDLYISITQGLDSMPAWQARLSQDERWAVIDYTRTFTYSPELGDEQATVLIPTITEEPNSDGDRLECVSYLDQENPYSWESSEEIAAGQNLYENNCTSCHGDDGTGRLTGILDFTDPSIHFDITTNSGIYLCSLSEGYKGMPSFKENLNEQELWQLMIYIATFGN